jgi:fructose-1,6-bisphosphatase
VHPRLVSGPCRQLVHTHTHTTFEFWKWWLTTSFSCVVFDPLDGSSNIDAGVNVGTIFGVYKVEEGKQGTVENVLRPGKEMVAAGYTM